MTDRYHDSGWRDSMGQFLHKHRGDITGFENGSRWYETVSVSSLNLPEKTR